MQDWKRCGREGCAACLRRRGVIRLVVGIALLFLMGSGQTGRASAGPASEPSGPLPVAACLAAAGDLVTLADAVVLGSLADARSYWSPDGRMIYTRFRVRVQAVVDGEADSILDLTAEGGSVGETTLVVSSFPELTVGESYLLLVGDLPDRRCVLGGSRGAFLLPAGDAGSEAAATRIGAVVRSIREAAAR